MSGDVVYAGQLGSAAGSPGAWQAAFGSEIDSLAAGDYELSSLIIDPTSGNTPNLMLEMTVSVALGALIMSAASPALDFYLQPLNQDGTTYGDGTASGTVLPSPSAYFGSLTWQTTSTSATATLSVKFEREVPATKFKLGVVNNLGNALASSGNTIQIALNTVNLNG